MPQIVACCHPLPSQPDIPDAEVRLAETSLRDRDEQIEHLKGAHAVITWPSERIDAPMLDAIGPQLRIVANCAVGYDNISLGACRERHVVATNTPDMVTDGTADIAWALLLGAARRVGEGDAYARSGEWTERGSLGPAEFIGQPIAGQTLHIVGAGRIGYATALRSVGWGMRVLYTARSAKPKFELAPLNAKHVGLEEGLAEADFISVHTPLTPETRHLIGADQLARCKPTAVLVSTARGPVIDERALAEALRDGRLFAAGLDVFEREPEIDPLLASLANTLFTPHIGSSDHRCRSRMVDLCARNIAAVLAGNDPITPIGR